MGAAGIGGAHAPRNLSHIQVRCELHTCIYEILLSMVFFFFKKYIEKQR